MKNNTFLLVFSYMLLPLLFGVVFLDFAGIFGYSDFAFVCAFSLYILFFVIQKGTSRTSFILSLFFLIIMGLSYIPTGFGSLTERMGEWFYLFFVFGLLQYTKEAWHT